MSDETYYCIRFLYVYVDGRYVGTCIAFYEVCFALEKATN